MKGMILIPRAAIGALAVALVATAVPSAAVAQNNSNANGWQQRNDSNRSGDRSTRRQGHTVRPTAQPDAAVLRREERPEARERAAAQYDAQRQAAQRQAAETQAARTSSRNRGDERNRGASNRDQNQRPPIRATVRGDNGRGENARNGTYRNDGRNSTYRDERRYDNRDYRGSDRRGYDNRDNRGSDYRGNRETYRDNHRDYRRSDNRYDNNHRQWNRRWRDNNRYNWYGYRNNNRSIFRIGAYYSPYRSYQYRRLGIGFRLDNSFYGNRYWVNDPYRYRLPEVYGPYRWVRYYDDVLLVNTYTGEVTDVIYDFFW